MKNKQVTAEGRIILSGKKKILADFPHFAPGRLGQAMGDLSTQSILDDLVDKLPLSHRVKVTFEVIGPFIDEEETT